MEFLVPSLGTAVGLYPTYFGSIPNGTSHFFGKESYEVEISL